MRPRAKDRMPHSVFLVSTTVTAGTTPGLADPVTGRAGASGPTAATPGSTGAATATLRPCGAGGMAFGSGSAAGATFGAVATVLGSGARLIPSARLGFAILLFTADVLCFALIPFAQWVA